MFFFRKGLKEFRVFDCRATSGNFFLRCRADGKKDISVLICSCSYCLKAMCISLIVSISRTNVCLFKGRQVDGYEMVNYFIKIVNLWLLRLFESDSQSISLYRLVRGTSFVAPVIPDSVAIL